MKRFLSILLSAVLVAAILPASAFISSAAESVKPGDVNFDGEVNVQDAIIIYRADAGLITLNDKQKAAGNIVGGDKSVNAADAIAVLRIDAGLKYDDGWVELDAPTEAVDAFNKDINKAN